MHNAVRAGKDGGGDSIARAFQKLKLHWNYHSNAIEGNQLTYGETVALLMHGVTAKGKSLKDHLDVKGHNEAINYMLDLIKRSRALSHNDIRELHEIILKEPYLVDVIDSTGQKSQRLVEIGQYKKHSNHVITRTGEIHYYVEPNEVHKEMTDLLQWHHAQSGKLHPIVLAAIFHHRFVAIHPFDDGNGRLGRILMNFILIGHDYPPAIISTNDRDNYYAQLSMADAGIYDGIIEYVCESVAKSLELQVAVLEGRDEDTLADIDKEIALFKAGLQPAERGEVTVTAEEKKNIALNFILPLARKIDARFSKLADLYNNPKRLYSLSCLGVEDRPISTVEDYERWIHEIIHEGKSDFSSFYFSYLLDSYKLSADTTKQGFNLYFSIDPHLFTVRSSGIPKASRLDFDADYADKVYYDKLDDIARIIVTEFMQFTKRVTKK